MKRALTFQMAPKVRAHTPGRRNGRGRDRRSLGVRPPNRCWISRYFVIHRVDYHGHPTADGHPRPTFGNRAGVLAAVKGALASRAAARP